MLSSLLSSSLLDGESAALLELEAGERGGYDKLIILEAGLAGLLPGSSPMCFMILYLYTLMYGLITITYCKYTILEYQTYQGNTQLRV